MARKKIQMIKTAIGPKYSFIAGSTYRVTQAIADALEADQACIVLGDDAADDEEQPQEIPTGQPENASAPKSKAR